VLEFMIRLADAVPAWCADANPIDVTEALVADNDYSVRVALFGLNAFGGGEPGNLRACRNDQANATTRGFFRNTLRTLDGIELLPATHLSEEIE